MEEVRLLTLEERVLLALLYFQIPELEEICKPDMVTAMKDASKVHRITQLIQDSHVPTLNTELTEDQFVALKTGRKPKGFKPKIKLNYTGVLSEKDGEKLEELFNVGTFIHQGQKTNRPLTTYRLMVPEEHVASLRRIHEKWLENRICILLEGEDGQCWITPDRLHTHTNTQDYVVVSAAHKLVDSRSEVFEETPRNPSSWRETLDEMVALRPSLGFVQLMLNHYLQPAHVQLMHHEQLEGKVLLLTYQGNTYRVTGITSQGTLMLTTHLHQGLVYEHTLPFRLVAHEGEWSQRLESSLK